MIEPHRQRPNAATLSRESRTSIAYTYNIVIQHTVIHGAVDHRNLVRKQAFLIYSLLFSSILLLYSTRLGLAIDICLSVRLSVRPSVHHHHHHNFSVA